MSEPIQWQMNSTGPEAYERYIVPAWMGEWAQALVDYSDVKSGERVLDVACGTGIVARKVACLVGPKGKVAGLDANEGMLRAARQFAERENIRGIEWHLNDASRMPFKHAEYDVVLCQQGLQFFSDKPAALREMARVLAPGGRCAISVWTSLYHNPFMAILTDAIENYLDTDSTAFFHTAYSLSSREELRALLSTAGFRDIHVRSEVKMVRYPSIEEYLPRFLSVFPIADSISAMPEADRAEMFQRISEALREYTDDDGLAIPKESHIITSAKG